MARIKCACGEQISNSSRPEIEYEILSDAQRNELSERTEKGENFVNIFGSVSTHSFWKCFTCGRLYVFEDGKDMPLQVYKVEKDNGGDW